MDWNGIDVIVCLFPGRLSKEEIERMVNEADQYKAEDDKQRARISAKNSLESYAFNMKSAVEEEKVKDKISEEDKKTVTDKCTEVINWLDSNQVRWLSYLNKPRTGKVCQKVVFAFNIVHSLLLI